MNSRVYKSRYGTEVDTLGNHVRSEVDGAPDYHDGMLESVAAKVIKIEQILQHLVEALAPAAQRRLAESLGYEECDSE